MEDPLRRERHDDKLASRRAEEAAWRRYQAMEWLDTLVGPLGISKQPTETEFISCLRNGLILCNAINKIKPGSVPKVVEIQTPSSFTTWDSQPLPAYQYFENIRNFLVIVEELKIPAFEACDLERDIVEVGSSAKVVDCILALKAYYEWKKISGGNGTFKPPRSPLNLHSVNKFQMQGSGASQSDTYRKLEMPKPCDNQQQTDLDTQKLEDLIAKSICDLMVGSKENIDDNILASFRNGSQDPVKLLSWIMSNCVDEANKPEIKSFFKDILGGDLESASLTSTPISATNSKCCRACKSNGNCRHRTIFKVQEKELLNLKELLSTTKQDFEALKNQLQSDFKQIGNQVQELSSAAQDYHKVVKENRNLYNMVQDLKGNIHVYCRIRPSFCAEAKNVVDFIGEDGTLVISDPSRTQKDGRKSFQFNRVFGPTATQEEVFKDTQPLIRSVMDGYNVCIFAYGQTGSGKTYTMCGPPGGSNRKTGINYYALDDLFQLSNTRKDIVKYEIHVQMVEIYNEQVRDLLTQDSSSSRLEIRSCASENGLSLPDAVMHSVKNTDDVINLMKLGETNRAVSSTAINHRSSRSHSILTVHVHGKDISGSTLHSCLHLVDLAGSERVDKSEVTGDSLKEAQYINKSLSCLGDVITALAQKNSHIPYRNSKLTLLLQNSLGGHAKTLMFAHMSPEADSFGETVSTLKFSQRVSTVELGQATMNKESTEVLALKEQVESLKKALRIKEAQTGLKEIRSPLAVNNRTPPRPRRLSIENCNSTKTHTAVNSVRKGPTNERTPPRPRRLSIENINPAKIEKSGPKTPLPVQARSRRLSIENPTKIEKPVISEKSSLQTPLPVQVRSRRLSIENPKVVPKKSLNIYLPQDAESATKPKLHVNSNVPVVDIYKSDAKKASTQLPKTPEPWEVTTNNPTQVMTQCRAKYLTEASTPGIVYSSSNGKTSHIRKSLRSTIGKLINGSDKRNHKKVAETPIKSPVSSGARALRRQSLTGVYQDRSRRSSLGGKSDSCTSGNRNSKTPPPVHPSDMATNRWL